MVSLTNVTLFNEGDRQGSTSDSPRVDPDQDTVTIEISENDNSRGLLEFAVSDVTVDEDVGSVELEVLRGSGSFGTVGASFTTTGVTASGGGVDYSPDSGSIQFGMDVVSQVITIDIINDSEAELEEVLKLILHSLMKHMHFNASLFCLQYFIVSLVDPQDGAVIGGLNTVTITIRRNDDINGVFSFSMDSVLVSTYTSPSDRVSGSNFVSLAIMNRRELYTT